MNDIDDIMGDTPEWEEPVEEAKKKRKTKAKADKKAIYNPITKPAHYNSHPSGIEPRMIVRHMTKCIGTAIEYLWRCDLKHKNAIEDLNKAIFWVEEEILARGGKVIRRDEADYV